MAAKLDRDDLSGRDQPDRSVNRQTAGSAVRLTELPHGTDDGTPVRSTLTKWVLVSEDMLRVEGRMLLATWARIPIWASVNTESIRDPEAM